MTDTLKKKILDLLERNPEGLSKNDLAKELYLNSDERIPLKKALKELQYEESVMRNRQRLFFLVGEESKETVERDRSSKTKLGILTVNARGGTISSCHRKDHAPPLRVPHATCQGIESGEVVLYGLLPGGQVKIYERLGNAHNPRTYSAMAIASYGLPHVFSGEAMGLAESGRVPTLGKRTDYRSLPLVTIDGEDARDFDDAVWAAPDTDSRNEGGWRVVVAIADVAYYVRPGDALDREAQKRGNSVYFPDRVVPMLPEALSNELCSLKPGEERACMAVEMIISAHGKVKSSRIKRGLMRSAARLTYTQVHHARQGIFDDGLTRMLYEEVVEPLYGVFYSLLKARTIRGTLEIEMPERRILFDDHGHVSGVRPRERFESHKMIEELMIAANVAAAKTLVAKNAPCLFRVHEVPDATRVTSLKQVLKTLKLPFPKTLKPTAHQFNDVLAVAKKKPYATMVQQLILRTQSQACYSPINNGHYGLSLTHYAHFTSPIRRYADLEVHRALITALDLGEGGRADTAPTHLHQVATHISATERQAAAAERDVTERFMTAYLASDIGDVFNVTVAGLNNFGLFVEVDGIGAQGFIPKWSLGHGPFHFDADHYQLQSRQHTFHLGDHLQAVLVAADPLTSSLSFEWVTEREHNRPTLKKSTQKGRETAVRKGLPSKNKSEKGKRRKGR